MRLPQKDFLVSGIQKKKKKHSGRGASEIVPLFTTLCKISQKNYWYEQNLFTKIVEVPVKNVCHDSCESNDRHHLEVAFR